MSPSSHDQIVPDRGTEPPFEVQPPGIETLGARRGRNQTVHSMYTVARFSAPARGQRLLREFVARVNDVEGAGFLTERANEQGYACELSVADAWGEHVRAMTRFLVDHVAHVRKLVDRGGHAELDTAVHPDDVDGDHLCTTPALPPDLIATLASCGA